MTKWVTVSLCLAMGLTAVAQTPSGAETALSRFVEATKAYDTAAMAALMHPDALKQFRGAINAALAGPKAEQAAKELLPLFSVTTVAAYSALSDTEAYKRLNDTIVRSDPSLLEMMSKSSFEIVGSVTKDGVAYVTYNLTLTIQGSPVKTQIVQTLRMYNDQWRLLLPPRAEATIVGIAARFK